MNSRVPEPVLSADPHCGLEIESVLRIRPLLRKEREDAVMLEQLETTRLGPETVVLNPLHPSLTSPVANSSLRNRADSDSTSINVPVEYHFNHVLPETTSQDKLYYTLGHPIASDTMRSLKTAAASRSYGTQKSMTHLLVCMGVANSGKTYTCFGGTTIPKRRAAQDGLVPRLMDSLFSQSKHNAGGPSRGFAVHISMMQVTQQSTACQIHDLLAFAKTKMVDTPSKLKANMTVRNMAARFERAVSSPGSRKTPEANKEEANTELNPENPKPTIESARDATQARELLQNGLNASEKLSKGNKNFHICVTMQPVLDGTKYGDNIVVLDMAGLEKEKSGGRSNRKSDNISSLNQTATAAVMRCLRVMTHNDNISSGKGNTIGICGPDDDVSEISFVSQAKDPMRKQLKPVPFRQHKITMLLNPLFTKSSLVKVKIILAAYPGHADLQQKRMLLQDVELLHGSSLVPPLSAIVETGMDHTQPRGILDSERTDEESSAGSVENKMTPNEAHQRFNNLALEHEARVRVRAVKSSQPGAVKMPKHYSGVTSKAIRVQKIENRPTSKPRVERSVQPSAPTFPEISTPREEISDFPGVNIPSSIGKSQKYYAGRLSIEKVMTEQNGTLVCERDNPISKSCDELKILQQEPSNASNKESRAIKNSNIRTPLERSSLENCMNHPSKAGDEKKVDKSDMQDKSIEYRTETEQKASPNVQFPTKTLKSDLTSVSQEDPSTKIKLLEKKLQEAIQEKNGLERICAQLEKENAALRNEAREAGRKVLQTQWTDQDEEEFMASRRMRREAQNLIAAPVQEHLEKVNYIYGIKNQWCMTNKKHFSLQFPNKFQRAPELNERDKAKKESESEQSENEDHHLIRQTRSEDIECVTGKRLSFYVTKPRNSLISFPKKTIPEPPKQLSALKRLNARRASNY
ncbi:kinesin motor domain containing protein [Nitzschia inconspicua]|uniref:Kinesin motor domain containing protein n=1 Tax=Nitzschia inconspicua TaxID=303405 RepID=A0A9K3KNL2_9STRA|nr:kinesin motor domain containing protein [Nitzschia inconspicua]